MATSNNRDVKMTLSVETLGADDIKKLQDSVAKLATEGGQAAPEFQKLADEIGRLGAQAAALQAFESLASNTAELAEKQAQAAKSSGELGAKLQTTGSEAKAAAKTQQELATTLAGLQKEAKATRDALDQQTAKTAEAKKADESYAATVSDLKLKKIEQRAEIEKLKAALGAAAAETKQAEAAEKKLADAYAYAATQAKAAAAALRENESSVKAAAEAAQALDVATDNVAASQAGLVQALNGAGRAALETKAAIDQYQDKLRAAKEEADATANAAKAAADKISNAFKTVGARSAEELRAEIVQVREAMATVRQSAAATGDAVAGAFAAGQARIKELERDIREVSGTLTMADRAAGLLKNSLGQITAGNIVADGVGYMVEKVKELGREFLGAIVQGDQMRRGLTAIYKDAGIAASQIDFLRKSSSESGVAFGQLSGEFVKFSAAMKSANVPLEQSNNLFKAVTAASASLGIGTEATAGALNALGQMASKGTVSLEELRQQLSDRIPGALGLAAQGLGITEAQLIKLVESGGLATRDFIVPFTSALNGLKGESDGLVPAFDRLKGTLTQVAQGMGDAGATAVLTGALKVLGGFVASVALGLSAIVEGLFLFGSTMTAVAARAMGDAKAFDFLAEQLDKSTKRLTGQADALNAFLDPSAAAAASTAQHAVALSAHTAEVVKSINANTSLGAEQKLAALSTALAADATLNASAKMVQYNVAAAELIKAQEGQTEAYTKTAKAAKEQGDTLVAMAKLTGDATAIQSASTQAAQLYSAALDKVAVSQAAETAMLVAQKAELLASAETRKLSAQDIKVETEALDKKITASQAETEQARQSALAQKAELYERQLAVAALKDHSAEVGKFKGAMEDAAATLKNYEILALNGKKTDADVAEARKALTTATVLYKDALTDLISKTELETKAKAANLQLASAQAKAGADHSLVLAEEARRRGDTATAIYYEIKAREQNIAVMKLEIQIRDLEAKAALMTIELKQKALDLSTEEGRKKFEILEIEKKVIEIKLLANGATKDAIAAMEREIAALREGTDLHGRSKGAIEGETGARRDNATAIDRQTSALEAQNAAIERANAANEKAIALENKRLNRDSEGFSLNTNGQRVNMDVQNQRSVYENAKSQGLSEAQALEISNQFITDRGEKIGWSNANTRGGENWGTELQKAIDQVVLSNAKNTANTARNTTTSATSTATPKNNTDSALKAYVEATGGRYTTGMTSAQADIAVAEARRSASGPAQTPMTAAELAAPVSQVTAPRVTTVNINLNGNTQSINTDAAGAAALQNILSQLGQAQSTSAR